MSNCEISIKLLFLLFPVSYFHDECERVFTGYKLSTKTEEDLRLKKIWFGVVGLIWL
jgi:hypothetical protein